MSNNGGGRRRWLSIYSSLIIVFLISIFGGCGCERGTLLTKSACTNAGLLLDASGIRYDVMEDSTSTSLTAAYFVELDGEGIWNTFYNLKDCLELSPGHHTFRAGLQRGSAILTDLFPVETMIEGSIDIEPHSVYVLIVMHDDKKGYDLVNQVIKNPNKSFPLYPKTKKTSYTYDYTTGIVTHPTDSKRSFRVK